MRYEIPVADHDPKPGAKRFFVPYALSLVPPVGWWVYWYLSGRGSDGCGPPANSAAAPVFWIVLFGLAPATAAVAVAYGVNRGWSRIALVGAALITIVAGGLLELFVIGTEFGLHHCGE